MSMCIFILKPVPAIILKLVCKTGMQSYIVIEDAA